MLAGIPWKRWPTVAFTFGCVLFNFSFVTEVHAQATLRNTSEWMLGVVTPNEKPDYFHFSDGGIDAGASVDLHPSDAANDKNDHASPATLELTYRVVAGSVRVQASVRFHAKKAAAAVALGDYVVRPDDSVMISQLSHFGLKAVELRLVSARPPEPTLLPVVNNTSSLIVENLDEDRAEYKLTARNVSRFPVEGVLVSVVGASGAPDMHRLSGYVTFLGSGAVREISISKEDNPSDAQQILIDAVLFEDGSYEGAQEGAAILEAAHTGREEQERRIADLVEKQLENTDADDEAKIAFLHSQVAALSVESEPSLVSAVLAKFPNLTNQQKQLIFENANEGLGNGKAIFLGNLEVYRLERQSGQVPGVSLQNWWVATKGRCDVLVRCSSGN